MAKYDIYGIGAALVDTEIEVNDSDLASANVSKGVMTLVDEARQQELCETLSEHLVHSKRASGGSGANSIIAASYFGSQNFYSCKVASDENGEFYLNDLREAGVSYHNHNGQKNGTTGKCLVLITPDAERSMNTFLGISETLSESDIDEAALINSDWAYIEGYLVTSSTGKPAAEKVRQLAKENDVKVAVSLSDPFIAEHFGDGMSDIIGEGVELIFCNEAEAQSFTKTSNLADACEKLKSIASTYAITCGADGAIVFDGDSEFKVAGTPVKAVDTNGAGDMFAGAFLHAIGDGKSYREAAIFANKAASVVVSQFGPRLEAEQHNLILESSSL